MTASALVNEDGLMYAIATTEREKGVKIDRKKGSHNGQQR